MDHLEVVFAPLFDVNQGEVEWGAVISDERVDGTEGLGGSEDVGGDDFVEEAVEFGVFKLDAVQLIEFLAKVGL